MIPILKWNLVVRDLVLFVVYVEYSILHLALIVLGFRLYIIFCT